MRLIFVFTSNFSLNSYFFVIVFFSNSHSDQTFSNFADLFCFRFCCNDLTVVQKCCYLVS